jgi:TolB protein
LLAAPLAVACLAAICGAGSLGPFESNSDIGAGLQKGKVELSGPGEYRVTGGGADMWGKADAFHFVWKKMSGNMALTADVLLTGASAQPKRKVTLMIRQSLDPGSAYVTGDAVLPKFLDTMMPERIRIERQGNTFTVMAGEPGGQLAALAPFTVNMTGPVYVGLAVCSHDANGLTSAAFTNVRLEAR